MPVNLLLVWRGIIYSESHPCTTFLQTSMPTTTVHHARKGPMPPTLLLFPRQPTRWRETIHNRTSPILPMAMGRQRRMATSRSRWSKTYALGRTPSSTSYSCLAPSGLALCSTTSTRRKCCLLFFPSDAFYPHSFLYIQVIWLSCWHETEGLFSFRF